MKWHESKVTRRKKRNLKVAASVASGTMCVQHKIFPTSKSLPEMLTDNQISKLQAQVIHEDIYFSAG